MILQKLDKLGEYYIGYIGEVANIGGGGKCSSLPSLDYTLHTVTQMPILELNFARAAHLLEKYSTMTKIELRSRPEHEQQQ